MKKFLIAMTVGATLVAPSFALAGNRVPLGQCQSWFNSADKNNDGSIGPTENASGYLRKVTFSGGGKASEEQTIMSKQFFMMECTIGSFGQPR